MKTVLLASVLAVSVGQAGSAEVAGKVPRAASGRMQFTAQKFNPPGDKKLKVLYNQNSNDTGESVDSQSFESSFSAYDDQGADDFVVPSGSIWKIREVDVTGVYFNGSGPAASENIFFYKDDRGEPGKQIASASNLNGKHDASGSFAIEVPTVTLKAGTYWVSVQANCSFEGGCGEWGWEVSSVQHGNQAEWRNPNEHMGGCPSWGPIETCVNASGPDFMFRLRGSD